MRHKISFFLGLLVCATMIMVGCHNSKGSPKAIVPSVNVSLPRQEQVSNYIDFTGTVASSRSVVLVARVPGYLRSVNFEDGAFVNEGQLLFVIEPEPYEQQLRLAQAALLQAQSEYDRQQTLMKDNATSAANVEKWLSQRDQAAAQVELAKINLGYTNVTAPCSGRMGRSLIDPGNLVGTSGSTTLATLDQIVPIHVYFNLNERDALVIRNLMKQESIDSQKVVGQARVLVGLQTEEGYPHEGILDFVNNQVSLSSGVIEMRAILKNEDKTLFPGLFARIRVPLGDPQPMLVVSNSVISNDQEGDYVLIVDAGNRVVRRSVEKGPLTANGCAIKSGLSADDRVIVDGLTQVSPGMQVAPVKN